MGDESVGVVKAEDIAHVLRDGVALLPGCRDRGGRALLVFPSREQAVHPDHIRNVLLYLHTVTADEARERGFVIVVDMRGKTTWNNVRPILKAINLLCESATVHVVLIIKPDKFWEKQKAQISLGFCKFEVQLVSLDALLRHFETTQLPRQLGGSFHFDHEDWLETRLELERWIWRTSDAMRGLEEQRRLLADQPQPVDVPTADTAIRSHSIAKRTLASVPLEAIQSEAARVEERISRRGRPPNPDLLASLPHMHNLIASLQQLKSDVFGHWEQRRSDLENTYQLKLLEQDADKMLEWSRQHCELLVRSMGDIGGNEAEAGDRLRQFAEFVAAAQNTEVNVCQISSVAARLRSGGGVRGRVDRAALQMQDEWARLQDLLAKRQKLLTTACGFYRATHTYFSSLSGWLEAPGVDPGSVDVRAADKLEEAIQQHERFWDTVEGTYAEAHDCGSQLSQALRGADLDESSTREQLARLQRAHKQLHSVWRERKVRLHSQLALIAFQTDTQLVVEWLEQHGETYLLKNTAIGETLEQARTLQRNHNHFRQIARNTYVNASKLFQASKTIIESGVCDEQRMLQLVGDLEARIQHFTTRVETRFALLNQSVLFHTHFNELMSWFGEMEAKYNNMSIDTDVEECERARERWLLESDATAQAYATTISEGTQLLAELQAQHKQWAVDPTQAVQCIRRLMGDIDSRNTRLTDAWSSQRVLLQVALKFANFVRENEEILTQIRNWKEDMQEMLDSATFVDNAEKVSPFHRDNTAQVKNAVKNIRRSAEELLQALHGQQLSELQTRQEDRVVELVRLQLLQLDKHERDVMGCAAETSARIDGARKLARVRQLAKEMLHMFEREERDLQSLSSIPSTLDEASRAVEAHREFQKRLEITNFDTARAFYELSNELIREGVVERTAVVELNEQVMIKWRRLVGLTEERHKLLKAAVGCYKTYSTGVVPILEQLEREYSQSPTRDWCQQRSGDSPQERVNYVSELLSKHMEYKDRFLKGCSYAQKTSELFLKYVQRTPTSHHYRSQHEERIMLMKADLRERQSKILELWTKKKKQLDRCQQFVLIDASQRQIVEWMEGEGEAALARFGRHAAAIGGMAAGDREAVREDFSAWKVAVKQERGRIQTVLVMCASLAVEAEQHKTDIEHVANELRKRFEVFSKRVSDTERLLTGEGGGKRDELSLDRHSDSKLEEKMADVKRGNEKMREPMAELLKSERDYIVDLGRCVSVYVGGFDAAGQSCPPALRDKRKELFGNIEKIHEFHSQRFLRELEKYENDPEEVGSCFTVWVDYLNELYTEYCVNKEQNMQLIAQPDAVQFFTSLRETNKLELNNDLASMLIKPVQRITRYRLLMEQLMKSSAGHMKEMKEAYDVVVAVPRRANDLIHLGCLDNKDKLGVVGPFVMQDTLTVWEPRAYFKGRGKERQVFLFEMCVVFAKRLELSPKNIRYVAKGKPVPLNEVSVVEHVEGDANRFGLRVGAAATNENRTDLRASSEACKVMWVRRIREFSQHLLHYNLGAQLDTASSSGVSSVSGRTSVSGRSSNASGDRLSRDADSLGAGNGHRFSVHSASSGEGVQPTDLYTVSVDFDATSDGQLSVRKGERVEVLEGEGGSSSTGEWVEISVVEDPARRGTVPASILLPDQPSGSTDRPSAEVGSNGKKKSLRRIFAPSSGKTSTAGPAPSVPAPSSNNPSSTAESLSQDRVCSGAVGVLSSCEVEERVDGSLADGLPPPMEDLDNLPLQTDNMAPEEDESAASAAAAVAAEPSEEEPPKQEKTPEETARYKRQFVLMELVETEKDYVRDLASVVEGYMANLNEMELPEEMIGKDKIIFANIAQILEFHKTSFLKDIEPCLSDYEACGRAFVKYERRLHTLYVKYCQNKPKSDYLVSQDDFEQFFADTKLKLGHKVALTDLLIKPVQRIMKYQLLLKDILKFTERANDSTVTLKKAMMVMHVVPKACDDMMQVGRLQNFDGNLNAQGKLIHQGTLLISECVAGAAPQKGKDRRIFLFEQSAIIADCILPKKEFGNPNYIFKNQIMVNKMVLDCSVSDDPLKFVIRSNDPAQNTSFVAHAGTTEEKEEWVAAISQQLDQQKTLLAALVDPKRYQSSLAGGIAAMSLDEDKKKAPASSSRFGGAKPAAAAAAKPESPKHTTKSKLFGFGKKSAKSPTSPPPVGKLK